MIQVYVYVYIYIYRGPIMIFMDIEMTEKNGYETSNQILNELYMGEQEKHIPYIVACSADKNIQAVEDAYDVGIKSFISKPIVIRELENTLSEFQVYR